jgi:hypothetical protein
MQRLPDAQRPPRGPQSPLPQHLPGRRCYGTFKGGVTALWDRCQSCEGHGQIGKQPRADGFGWRVYA